MLNNKIQGLVISDIHFGAGDPEKLYERINKVFLKEVEKKKETLDFIVIAGDTLDKEMKGSSKTLSYYMKFIINLLEITEKNNIKLRIIRGTKSHDSNQLNLIKPLQTKLFKVIDTVENEALLDNLSVLYIPEEYMSNQEEYYKEYFEVAKGDIKYDMIFFHGTFNFAGFVSNLESEKNIKNAPLFKAESIAKLAHGPIIGGHIHIKIKYNDKIFYTGSFDRFAFGEDEAKGFYEVLYNPEDGKYDMNFIENKLAESYVTIDLDNLLKNKNTEERLTIIEGLKEDFNNVRLKSDSIELEELESIKNLGNGVKIDVKLKNPLIDEKCNPEYKFLIMREFDLPESIRRFIKIKFDKEISYEKLLEIISEK